jgi:hypothetical protein
MGKLKDHDLLDKFLGIILDRYKTGELDRYDAIDRIARIVEACDGRERSHH